MNDFNTDADIESVSPQPVNETVTPSSSPPPPTEMGNDLNHGQRLVVALGYISFLCILPILLYRESTYAQFHGKQALVFAVLWYFLDLLLALSGLTSLLYVFLKYFLMLFLIWHCLNGTRMRWPVIASIADRLDFSATKTEKAAGS